VGSVDVHCVDHCLHFQVQPQVLVNLKTWPWIYFSGAGVAGLAGVAFELVKKDETKAFLASCAYLTGMLASVVFGSIRCHAGAQSRLLDDRREREGRRLCLKIGLIWWVIGMILAASYFRLATVLRGKSSTDGKSHGYGH